MDARMHSAAGRLHGWNGHSGGLAVWRTGGLADWRSGGLAVWRPQDRNHRYSLQPILPDLVQQRPRAELQQVCSARLVAAGAIECLLDESFLEQCAMFFDA